LFASKFSSRAARTRVERRDPSFYGSRDRTTCTRFPYSNQSDVRKSSLDFVRSAKP
jgi:hypothetical protein